MNIKSKTQMLMESTSTPSSSRNRAQRVQRYKVWALQRKFAEIGAQVEAAIVEARNLIASKCQQQPRVVADLTEEDKTALEAEHRKRMADIAQKTCGSILKQIMGHKWAFPFNVPVDTTRFVDYLRVVKTPMDFSTIKHRLDVAMYKDPRDTWQDINLVFNNAKVYNPPGSDVFLMAQTLQEFAQERHDKALAPKLAEEAVQQLRDEVATKKRRAEILNASDNEALERQCSKLLVFVDDIYAAIQDTKSAAASLCEGVSKEELQQLAVAIQALPTSQLEAAVALVVTRHPGMLHPQQNGAAAPGRKVQLNLGKYDALTLRQLQLFTAKCAERPPPPTDGEATAEGKTSGDLAARAATTAPQTSQASAAPTAPTAPAPAGGQEPAGCQAAGAGGGPGADKMLHSSSGLVRVDSASHTPIDVDLPEQESRPQGMDVDAPEGAGVNGSGHGKDGAAAIAGSSQQHMTSAFAAAANVALPASSPDHGRTANANGAGRSMRNIADVISHAPTASIAAKAAIAWPGLPCGAGIVAKARAQIKGGESLEEFSYEPPVTTPTWPLASSRSFSAASGTLGAFTTAKVGAKRRAPTPIQVDFSTPRADSGSLRLAAVGAGGGGAFSLGQGASRQHLRNGSGALDLMLPTSTPDSFGAAGGAQGDLDVARGLMSTSGSGMGDSVALLAANSLQQQLSRAGLLQSSSSLGTGSAQNLAALAQAGGNGVGSSAVAAPTRTTHTLLHSAAVTRLQLPGGLQPRPPVSVPPSGAPMPTGSAPVLDLTSGVTTMNAPFNMMQQLAAAASDPTRRVNVASVQAAMQVLAAKHQQQQQQQQQQQHPPATAAASSAPAITPAIAGSVEAQGSDPATAQLTAALSAATAHLQQQVQRQVVLDLSGTPRNTSSATSESEQQAAMAQALMAAAAAAAAVQQQQSHTPAQQPFLHPQQPQPQQQQPLPSMAAQAAVSAPPLGATPSTQIPVTSLPPPLGASLPAQPIQLASIHPPAQPGSVKQAGDVQPSTAPGNIS